MRFLACSSDRVNCGYLLAVSSLNIHHQNLPGLTLLITHSSQVMRGRDEDQGEGVRLAGAEVRGVSV